MENLFGSNLKNLRKENGLSQSAIAKRIGVTQQCVSEWEKGNMEPTLSNLWQLADLFNLPIDALVGRTDY